MDEELEKTFDDVIKKLTAASGAQVEGQKLLHFTQSVQNLSNAKATLKAIPDSVSAGTAKKI